MVHNEIHALDLAIIAAYLIAMVLIGLVVVKKVKKLVAVVAYVQDLKVDKLHCSVVFQNVDSLTSTLKNTHL